MKPLEGKCILFIGIGFYDYENAIVKELNSLGALVLVREELPASASTGFWTPALRHFGYDFKSAIRRHHANIIDSVKQIPHLDFVLVIKGQHLNDEFLAVLRKLHPQAKFIAYHWDSMSRYPELVQRQKFFDRVFTFDHADAATHPEFTLRPLFFRNEIAKISQNAVNHKYSLSFVGWLHHQRLHQIRAIAKWSKVRGVNVFFYLYTGRFTYLKLKLNGQGQFVHAKTLSFSKYITETASSKIVVDLPHPQQTGLTMRSIESLGAQKKLITTAKEISQYDFYKPENVMVINADRLEIDMNFIDNIEYSPVDPHIVEKYSLRKWISDIFEIRHFSAGIDPQL